MVFRKPYAFLIRYFRLIHLFITGLLGVLFFKSLNVYNFINDCIGNSVNKYNALEYVDYSIYIYMGIVIVFMYIVNHLLKYKEKPRNIYLFSIFVYVIIGVIFFVTYSYFGVIVNNVIDQKVIRLYRDILVISLLIQLFIVVFMFIRGLGFDIKKFNFSKDAQELNLVSEDGEEVYVDVSVDTTSVMRRIRKQKREFGYFFKEYKLYITLIFLILFMFFGYKGYSYLSNKFKVYDEGDWIGSNNYISIRNSYYSVDGNDKYVVVSFDIYKSGRSEQFNANNIYLLVDGNKYSVNRNICYNFNNIGNCYKRQYITSEVNSYIVTYEIDDYKDKNIYFVYNESYDKSYKVKLDLEEY